MLILSNADYSLIFEFIIYSDSKPKTEDSHKQNFIFKFILTESILTLVSCLDYI